MPIGPGPNRRPNRQLRPELAPLEPRQLLSAGANTSTRTVPPVEPTGDEQYMLQLINRARAHPAQETRRLLAVARTDPAVRQMVRRWPLGRFRAAMSGYKEALPPLAFNPRLIEAARDRNDAMLATNDQRHAPDGFLTNAEIARADDENAYYDIGDGAWSWGENLFAYSRNVRSSKLSDYVEYFHAGLMIDWGNPDFGHLRNIMAPGPGSRSPANHRPYREIGIGLLANAHPTAPPPANPANPLNARLNVGPVLVSQEFAYREGPAFLTGAVYHDTDHDAFYTPGEGLGGVTVIASGQNGEGTFSTETWDSGGYTLALPAGSYQVTIAGPNAPIQTRSITIDQDNIGWDVSYETEPQPIAPKRPTFARALRFGESRPSATPQPAPIASGSPRSRR